MRHRKIGRQLSRNSSHRKATLQSLTNAVILHGGIKTTVAKAKELRRVVEPLVTRSKSDSVHNRRIAFARLRDDVTVGMLFNDLGPRYKERAGGYMRIIKCGYRSGDNAPMAYIEFVDRPQETAASA